MTLSHQTPAPIPLTLEPFSVGPLAENCYVLAASQPDATGNKPAVLIDPGDESTRLLAALQRQQLTLEAIWLTHAHFDHVGAVQPIVDAWTAAHTDVHTDSLPVLLHPEGQALYNQAAAVASSYGLSIPQPQAPTTAIGATAATPSTLYFAGHAVQCLYTPGHAPGHIAFYIPEHKWVIAGDALFAGSIGRTDLPGGNLTQLLESIRDQLLTLPDTTQVYPGHGPPTTIGQERTTNPFLQSL